MKTVCHPLKKLFIANDHAGYELKKFLIKNHPNYPWEDLGSQSTRRCDYPDRAKALCAKINDQSLGVLVCKTGQGMAITANRFYGIRAVVALNETAVYFARQHNNANVLCLGDMLLDAHKAGELLKVFINTPFQAGRHTARINKIDKINNNRTLTR